MPSTRALSRSFFDHPKDGPLPAILLVLTVVTGVVDAVSILGLGRVFVANMTGNVVFIGFALAGAAGFSLVASLAALGGFLAGAAVGGRLIRGFAAARGRLLARCLQLEVALVIAATVGALIGGHKISAGSRDVVAAIAAVAMGMQNAVVRKLAVADLTTTVLTMTLTAIASDLDGAVRVAVVLRRVLSVLSMLVGAIIGAVLVLHVSVAAAFGCALALLAVVAAATMRAVSGAPAWSTS